MNTSLFKLSLEKLEPSDWGLFEELCSNFLVSEFPGLRTMAHPSGDGGRDSELFCPAEEVYIVTQYSIAADWKSKIRATVKRLKETLPDVNYLVYMSNKLIGGQADELKAELRKVGIVLDSRDRSWFIERANTDVIRATAAEGLIQRIARPYLEGEKVIEKTTSPLTSGEARAALVYLGLQWQDDDTDKGLTKLSFDALVRASLRNSHSENRIPRETIYKEVSTNLPTTNQEVLRRHVDAAIKRLTKKYIRHWTKDDEFCLTHDEHERILLLLAEREIEEADFHEEIGIHCQDCLCEIKSETRPDANDLTKRVPRIIEQLLLRRGEAFVAAVLSENLKRIGIEDLSDSIIHDIQSYPPTPKSGLHIFLKQSPP